MKRCWSCGSARETCEDEECTLCAECCGCERDEDDFDADELGLDPEEKYDA